jgi:hypothetical protein
VRNVSSEEVTSSSTITWPERHWSRLHADYAGTFMGKMFLVVIDAAFVKNFLPG